MRLRTVRSSRRTCWFPIRNQQPAPPPLSVLGLVELESGALLACERRQQDLLSLAQTKRLPDLDESQTLAVRPPRQ